MIKEVMENTDTINFDIPSNVLDEIQMNIQNIIKSFDIPDANKTEVIKKINFMYTQTKQMSITDPLTRLFNRRHFEVEFEREFKRAKRYNNPLSIAIADIDFFKKVNDTYGHSCGDYVLREIAYIISNNFRQTDLIFRYGGEEFVIILTETSGEKALIPLERLRKAVENYDFRYNNQNFKITLSIGVSSNMKLATTSEFFDDADKGLYKAKNNGRNQIAQQETE